MSAIVDQDTPEADKVSGRREGSLEDLYVRHAPEAVRLAFLLTSDGALAEDITQDAFIRVAGRFRHLRSPGAFDAYLRRTVVNLCMSHHRRRRLERTYLERERTRPGRAAEQPDLESRDELRRAMQSLPMRQRAAVALRYYADLPEQQVAEALGCSVSAARSLVFRAMETLRTTIGSEER
ncbi:MAG: RNA polymerase sigma factor [Actinomycetota bacterium]